jgi:hypothetical protein
MCFLLVKLSGALSNLALLVIVYVIIKYKVTQFIISNTK